MGKGPEMPWSCVVGCITISVLSLPGDSESASLPEAPQVLCPVRCLSAQLGTPQPLGDVKWDTDLGFRAFSLQPCIGGGGVQIAAPFVIGRSVSGSQHLLQSHLQFWSL